MQRDTHEFVAYFQTEMEKKDELIATLKDRVANLEYELRKQTREITDRLESEIRMREEAALETETKLKRKLAAAEDDLYALRNFRDHKVCIVLFSFRVCVFRRGASPHRYTPQERVDAQVKALKDELERRETSYKEEMTTMERKFLEDKSRILRNHAEQFTVCSCVFLPLPLSLCLSLRPPCAPTSTPSSSSSSSPPPHKQDTKRRAREEAQKQLDSDTKRVILDNRRMGEELRFQQQETAILQQEKEQVEAQNKRLARELELFVDKEKEYARQGSRRARDNKDLKDKVRALEGTVGKLTRDAERSSTALVAKGSEESEDLRMEVHALRQLVKLKNKELRTLKKLAETILSQRTEVETFFLEALDQVKAGIRQQREMTRKTTASVKGTMASSGRHLKFPALADGGGGTGAGAGAGAGAAGKVELKDLSLEDRERVLRLLFAKINAVSSRPRRPTTSGSDPGSFMDGPSLLSRGGHGDDVHLGGPFGLTAGIPETEAVEFS